MSHRWQKKRTPTAKTVNDLLDEYFAIYGVNNWAMSTYESRRSLMSNYVRPLIGEMQLSALNTRVMDQFYRSLQKVKPVVVNNVQPKNEFLTAHTVREIHKILRTAFNQAVKWELMPKNPVVNATLPKEEHVPRNIWTADTCAPRLRGDWSPENKTLGQCSITAFLMQDIYGGKVYGIARSGGNYHCFNDVDGCVFDLTSEQFGDEKLDYTDCQEQFRDVHFQKEEKRQRYELLKERLEKAVNG